MKSPALVSFVLCVLMLCSVQAMAAATPPKGAVLTWHDDNFRTGWQQQESTLTTSTIGSLEFPFRWRWRIRSTGSRWSSQVSSAATTSPLSPTNRITSTRSTQALASFSSRSILGLRFRGRLVAEAGPTWELIPPGDRLGQPDIVRHRLCQRRRRHSTYFLHALNLTTLADKVPPLQVQASISDRWLRR